MLRDDKSSKLGERIPSPNGSTSALSGIGRLAEEISVVLANIENDQDADGLQNHSFVSSPVIARNCLHAARCFSDAIVVTGVVTRNLFRLLIWAKYLSRKSTVIVSLSFVYLRANQ